MAEPTKVQELEREKERLIYQYLGLQDQADALNERIYHLCCDIEILNKRIEQAREEERKKKLVAQAQAAGKPVVAAGGGGTVDVNVNAEPRANGHGNGNGHAK